MQHLQMTDPDDRRDRAITAIPAQVTFGAQLAAMISQTVLPEGWNRPLANRVPIMGVPLDNVQPIAGPSNLTGQNFGIAQTVIPADWDRPLAIPIAQLRNVLQNPLPILPSVQGGRGCGRGRGRGQGMILAPIYDLDQRARIADLEQNLMAEQRRRDEKLRVAQGAQQLLAERLQQQQEQNDRLRQRDELLELNRQRLLAEAQQQQQRNEELALEEEREV